LLLRLGLLDRSVIGCDLRAPLLRILFRSGAALGEILGELFL
jgi:hypothetical protein